MTGVRPLAASSLGRPRYAIFDDFGRDQMITVYVRWALIALFLYTNHFRTLASLRLQFWVDLILVAGTAI